MSDREDNMARRLRTVITALTAALTLAACTSGGGGGPSGSATPTPSSTPTKVTPSSTPSSSAFVDPQIQPAIVAYKDYNAAYSKAVQQPSNAGLFKAVADRTFDPLQAQLGSDLGKLQASGIAFGGTPPTVRISVLAAELNGKPYPSVSLSDCPTPPTNWAAYNAKTGKKLPPTSQKAQPPYRTTATVIYFAKHWGVQKISTDYTKTCSA